MQILHLLAAVLLLVNATAQLHLEGRIRNYEVIRLKNRRQKRSAAYLTASNPSEEVSFTAFGRDYSLVLKPGVFAPSSRGRHRRRRQDRRILPGPKAILQRTRQRKQKSEGVLHAQRRPRRDRTHRFQAGFALLRTRFGPPEERRRAFRRRRHSRVQGVRCR
ncbi:hypothetical protein L596_014860 [Steinernema carpocapsae]|uniref:Uncharacterized protein n=1 Tax=Steinernema carpocapsae TaxID=34508 RepID=A0A4U5NED2_STECR|nr:hypothetical protein L596_014860 [Steinernema carpocapsae]